MGAWLAGVALLVAGASSALAQDAAVVDAPVEAGAPPPDATPATAGDPQAGEIVVFGDLEVSRRRSEVIRDLRALGYKAGKRKDGYTQFRPESPWKPTVRVYDDGFVVIKRTPPRWQAPGNPNNKLNNLWCLPPFTPMCVKVGGVLVSKRKLEPQKARVANALDPGLRAWRDALSARAMDEKVGQTLPDQLDALWQDGAPLEGAEGRLEDMADRRASLLGLWANRTCTPEGAMVREVVELFLAYEVQTSPFPATEAELQAAEAAHVCGDRLDAARPRSEPQGAP